MPHVRQKYNRTEEERPLPLIGSRSKAESELKTPYWGLSYNFPWNPDPLCAGNNYSIYDEMIDDDQVKAVLSIKKDMVVNTGWKITGDNEKVNQFVTENLEHINENTGLDSTFDDVLRDMLSAYDYGFSLTEPVYTIKNGKYYYLSLKTRAPHSFKFNVDKYGNVISITQTTSSGEKEFKPSQFIHHVYQMQFGNPYGKSDLRAAYKAWKAKNFFSKFFAIYVEKFASGTVVGKYPRNYSPSEIDEFFEVIKSIQNATTLVAPEDTEIEFKQLEREAGSIYLKGLDYYNMQIARSILVPDLMGIGGTETKGGSYALGKEQFKVFLSSIKKDRESLARKITMKLVRPLVLSNFGDINCKFEFLPYTLGDIENYLKIWIELVKAGGYIPTDRDIEYFKSVIGFPTSDSKSKSTAVPVAKKPEKEEQNKIGIETYTMPYHRELTKYERKMNFGSIKRTLDLNDKLVARKLKTDAALIIHSLVSQIRDEGFLRKFNPAKLNKLQPKYLKQMNQTLKHYYTDLFKSAIQEAKHEMFPQGDIKKFAIDLLPDEYLELLQAEAFSTVGDYAFNVTKKTKNMIIQGMKDGVSESEMLKIVRNELTAETDRWIQTVARTKNTEIYNEARKKYWETDPLAKQIVEAYQWSAILDDRTSQVCSYLDGKIFKVGELEFLKPPAHFNCRCVLVPITKFEEYKPNPKSDFDQDKLKKMGGGLLKIGG